jgi:hypothetical protein
MTGFAEKFAKMVILCYDVFATRDFAIGKFV